MTKGMPNPPPASKPPPEARQCIARSKRTGKRCQSWTVAEGINVCKYHGGGAYDVVRGEWMGGVNNRDAARTTSIIKGIPTTIFDAKRLEQSSQFQEINSEIALARALVVTTLNDHQKVPGKDLGYIVKQLDTITKMVERRHKMEHAPGVSLSKRDLEAFVIKVIALSQEHFAAQQPSAYRAFLYAIRRLIDPLTPTPVPASLGPPESAPIVVEAQEEQVETEAVDVPS
jgi:hypothetical protein